MLEVSLSSLMNIICSRPQDTIVSRWARRLICSKWLIQGVQPYCRWMIHKPKLMTTNVVTVLIGWEHKAFTNCLFWSWMMKCIYIYLWTVTHLPRSKIKMILKIALFMLLFNMKKNIHIGMGYWRSFFSINTLLKKVASQLHQNLWIKLGVLSKKIHSCSQLKGHMFHLKKVSPNSICCPAAKELMYFNLQQSLGLFKVPVTQTAETSFQVTSR